MITGWMGLAPFGDLGGAHFLVLWADNEVHSAFPSHQAARQTNASSFVAHERVTASLFNRRSK
jgi:hypothetical protein